MSSDSDSWLFGGSIDFASRNYSEIKKLMADCNRDSCHQASKDFETLFEDDKFSDVTFVVGAKEFKGHKNILAARSPVFAAMFEHDFIEKQESKVLITDVSEDAFEQLLRYIYTFKCPDLEQFASDLFSAADKVCLFFINFKLINYNFFSMFYY